MAIVPAKASNTVTLGLGRLEAFEIQKRLIDEWRPKSEAWTLKYGQLVVGIAAAFNGVMINTIFRSKMKLLHHGYLTTTGLLAIGPGFAAAVLHEHTTTHRILLHEVQCLPCEMMKANLGLLCTGTIYPLLLAPLVSLGIAGNIGYRIPHISEFKEVCKLWWSICRPNCGKLAYLMLTNVIIANIVTYKQYWAMDKITNILQVVRKRVINLENQQNYA